MSVASNCKRCRGNGVGNADVYEHYTRRDDLPKVHCNYMVECRHCRLAFEECSMRTQSHPRFKRTVKLKDIFVSKNTIPQLIRHTKSCIFEQSTIQIEESEEASAQEKSRVSSSSTKSSGNLPNPFQPLLNAPLTPQQIIEFHRLLLHFTVAAGLPFSWVELNEAIDLFKFIRKVIVYFSKQIISYTRFTFYRLLFLPYPLVTP